MQTSGLLEEWLIRAAFAVVPAAITAGLAWRRHRELLRRLEEHRRLLEAVLDQVRKDRDERTRSVAQEVVGPPTDPRLEETELREALGEAIMALPEREKLVVTLYYYEEVPLPEIARILGVSQATVSRLQQRALLRLKARLADEST